MQQTNPTGTDPSEQAHGHPTSTSKAGYAPRAPGMGPPEKGINVPVPGVSLPTLPPGRLGGRATELNLCRHSPKGITKWLEKFPEEEAVRGVAGSAPVPLVGSVVINATMIEYIKSNKSTQDLGPKILVRFKICAKGKTDWVTCT